VTHLYRKKKAVLKRKDWLTKELKISIKIKIDMGQEYMKSKDPILKTRYYKPKRQVHKNNQAVREFEQKIASNAKRILIYQ
jgi:hypothetical protein